MESGTSATAQEHIVAAATKVFATEATRQVTLKRVALEARVPAATVTEHYATPVELLSSVIASLAAAIQARFPEGEAPITGGGLDDEQNAIFDAIVMITTRAVLDGVDPAEIVPSFPVVDRLAGEAVDRGLDERTARYRIFETFLLEFAHRCFARPMADICGLRDESDECLRRELDTLEASLQGLPPVDPC